MASNDSIIEYGMIDLDIAHESTDLQPAMGGELVVEEVKDDEDEREGAEGHISVQSAALIQDGEAVLQLIHDAFSDITEKLRPVLDFNDLDTPVSQLQLTNSSGVPIPYARGYGVDLLVRRTKSVRSHQYIAKKMLNQAGQDTTLIFLWGNDPDHSFTLSHRMNRLREDWKKWIEDNERAENSLLPLQLRAWNTLLHSKEMQKNTVYTTSKEIELPATDDEPTLFEACLPALHSSLQYEEQAKPEPYKVPEEQYNSFYNRLSGTSPEAQLKIEDLAGFMGKLVVENDPGDSSTGDADIAARLAAGEPMDLD